MHDKAFLLLHQKQIQMQIDYPYPENFRQEWCPLIELPKKKQEKYSPFGSYDTYEEKVDSVIVGYNQCLDDICKNDESKRE